MGIFVEKWPLFSRSIIPKNTKVTEKLIKNKIFVIFSRILRNFSRIFFEHFFQFSKPTVVFEFI